MQKYIKIVVWFLIITYISLIPSDKIPESQFFNIPYFDKIVHFGIYFIFSILLASLFKKQNINKLTTILIILSLNAIIGGAIEILQDILPINRSGSYCDFIADMFGSITGLFLYYNLKAVKKIDKYL